MLRVRPQINENGTVKMAIYQEVSKIDDATLKNANGPTTTKRSIESNVLVDDGASSCWAACWKTLHRPRTRCPCWATSRCGQPVPQRKPLAQEDQPDGLPAPVVVRDAAASDALMIDRYESIRALQQQVQPPPAACWAMCGCARAASLRTERSARTQRPVTMRHPCPTPLPAQPAAAGGRRPAAVLWHGPRPTRAVRSAAQARRAAPAVAGRGRWPSASAPPTQGESSAATVVSEVESDADLSRMMQELPAVEDLLETADDAPIIRMLNALLTQAARDGASDIHIEPYERHSVRFRVDGTLREVVQPNRALHAALISRLKIMADLDIAEKRLPQDGRISLRLGTRAIDVRVSTLPSAHGERAVLRLLDKSESKLSLEAVGMQGDTLRRFEA
jgi:type II secretory ATPase GspE/PulE/Tfp pilus assembly ATPase PilB-like protein